MSQKELLQSKILDAAALQHKLHYWRFKDQRIVFTNGCFDLMHPGHIHILTAARDMGDVLIVGLNSDISTKGLKGPNRPIMHQDARAQLLAAFSFVDAVVLFDEPTPINLITTIMPNVLVKGGDYTIDNIVGAKEVIAAGGRVETVPFLEGYSTTSIAARITDNR